MEFNNVINYLEELKNNITNEEINPEEKILIIIKYAILTDNFYRGRILFTKENNKYKVSTIQKHSYGYLLQDKIIDIDKLISNLNKLDISYSLTHYPISNHQNDYELYFGIPKLNKIKTRTNKS